MTNIGAWKMTVVWVTGPGKSEIFHQRNTHAGLPCPHPLLKYYIVTAVFHTRIGRTTEWGGGGGGCWHLLHNDITSDVI